MFDHVINENLGARNRYFLSAGHFAHPFSCRFRRLESETVETVRIPLIGKVAAIAIAVIVGVGLYLATQSALLAVGVGLLTFYTLASQYKFSVIRRSYYQGPQPSANPFYPQTRRFYGFYWTPFPKPTFFNRRSNVIHLPPAPRVAIMRTPTNSVPSTHDTRRSGARRTLSPNALGQDNLTRYGATGGSPRVDTPMPPSRAQVEKVDEAFRFHNRPPRHSTTFGGGLLSQSGQNVSSNNPPSHNPFSPMIRDLGTTRRSDLLGGGATTPSRFKAATPSASQSSSSSKTTVAFSGRRGTQILGSDESAQARFPVKK